MTDTKWIRNSIWKIRSAYHSYRKTSFCGWNVKWNGSTRWKFSETEGMASKVFLFFRFKRKAKIPLVLFSHPRSTTLWTLALLAPGYQAGLDRLWQMVQHRILTRFYCKKYTVPKLPPKNSMQMVSALGTRKAKATGIGGTIRSIEYKFYHNFSPQNNGTLVKVIQQ